MPAFYGHYILRYVSTDLGKTICFQPKIAMGRQKAREHVKKLTVDAKTCMIGSSDGLAYAFFLYVVPNEKVTI